jgi:1-phosphatidylinositol-3-phosphate 5-kinase
MSNEHSHPSHKRRPAHRYRKADGTKSTHYLLMQENLFYGKNVARMCDLKGAHRNRGSEDENETVLDENLFRFNNGYPLMLSEAAKSTLTRALWNDTLFLASINVMDYSLLVGMVQTSSPDNGSGLQSGKGDPSSGEWTLVVGLIDYCRQYTWREEAESRVKRGTVIQPKHYKRRFREALHRYFMASIEKYH